MRNSTKTPTSFPDSVTPATVFSAPIEFPSDANRDRSGAGVPAHSPGEVPLRPQLLPFPFAIAAPLFLALILLFSACGSLSDQDRDAVMQALADTLERNTETWDVRMEIMEDQFRKIFVTSPYATTLERPEGSITTLYGPVMIQIRDSLGNPETIVTSEKAIYEGRLGLFTFYNDVYVETAEDKKLRTDHLIWSQDTRSIETTGYVTITTPADSIAGYGLNGDDRLEIYTITRVTGFITVETRRDRENSGSSSGSGADSENNSQPEGGGSPAMDRNGVPKTEPKIEPDAEPVTKPENQPNSKTNILPGNVPDLTTDTRLDAGTDIQALSNTNSGIAMEFSVYAGGKFVGKHEPASGSGSFSEYL